MQLARRSNTKPKLGAQFDTAADLFTFGFAPAAMILSILYFFNPYLAAIVSGVYLFSASFRLSRFMIDQTTSRMGYFKGMPSPPAALFIAGWFLLPEVNPAIASLYFVFIAGIMISSLPYTAMRIVNTLFLKIFFGFTIVMMLAFTYAPDSWMISIGYFWIGYGLFYGLFGPKHAIRTLVKENHYQ